MVRLKADTTYVASGFSRTGSNLEQEPRSEKWEL